MNIYHEHKPFCVYLTIYQGNKLPPFYIGSSSVAKVNEGYRGSVDSEEYRDTWKSELANNPHLFRTVIVLYTSTRESAYDREGYFHDRLDVVRSPLYINRSSASFRFDNTGKRMPEEQKKKISKTSRGHKKSEVTKLRMKKPKTEEHNKNNSESRKKVKSVICPHCKKKGDPAAMTRWHFERCKQNPNREVPPKPQEKTCEYCGRTMDPANHKKYHGDNCKHKA